MVFGQNNERALILKIRCLQTDMYTQLHTPAIQTHTYCIYSCKCRCTYKCMCTFASTRIHPKQEAQLHSPNSGLNQSTPVSLIMMCCMGKRVRYSRKAVIKTSGSRVLRRSGSLRVQLIWRREIANSWPLNAMNSHQVSPFFHSCCFLFSGEHWRGLALSGDVGWGIIIHKNRKRQV